MKHLKIAGFTLFETLALVVRLAIGTGLGTAAMAVSFVLEHLTSYNVKNNRAFFSLPPRLGALIGIAVFETIVWEVWLQLLAGGGTTVAILAGFILALGLELGHIPELNVVNRYSLFYRFFDRAEKSLDITTIELVTGIVWLQVAAQAEQGAIGAGPFAAIVLFIGLFVEHVISSRKVLRP